MREIILFSREAYDPIPPAYKQLCKCLIGAYESSGSLQSVMQFPHGRIAA